MTMDEFAKWVSIGKDAILGIGAGVTAVIAFLSLNKWRSELSGKHEYEVARELMRATYGLRDAIYDCRAPFISSSEFPAGTQDADGYAHVFRNRYRPVVDALKEFDTRALEAEALWGSAIRSKTDEMRSCVSSLYAAIMAFIDNERSGGQDFKDREFGKRIRGVVSRSGDTADSDFSKQVSAAIAGIEAQVRPHLKRG